jgi:hypothetical protein
VFFCKPEFEEKKYRKEGISFTNKMIFFSPRKEVKEMPPASGCQILIWIYRPH